MYAHMSHVYGLWDSSTHTREVYFELDVHSFANKKFPHYDLSYDMQESDCVLQHSKSGRKHRHMTH